MLKVGDTVIVEKPEDTDEFPQWIYSMDIYNGRSYEIKEVEETRGVVVCALYGTANFYFKDSWLKLKNTRYWMVEDV